MKYAWVNKHDTPSPLICSFIIETVAKLVKIFKLDAHELGSSEGGEKDLSRITMNIISKLAVREC